MGVVTSKQTVQQESSTETSIIGQISKFFDRTEKASDGDVIQHRYVPDQMVTIDLPAKMFCHSAGVAFDIGGSRCKISFAKHINSESSEAPSDDQVCVTMAVFHREELSEALDYIKRNIADDSSVYSRHSKEKRVVKTCGLSMGQDTKERIARDLQTEVRRVDEFSLTVNGFKCLLNAIPDDDMFYEQSKKVAEKLKKLGAGLMQMIMSLQPPVEQTPIQSDTSPEPTAAATREKTDTHLPTGVTENVPYMVVCVGSGTSCMLVSPDGSSRFVSGSTQGGTVLLSLAKLLVGTSDYTELMDLAAKGDETMVSTVSRDLRNNNTGDKDYYAFMPEDMVVFPLGKILDRKSAGARREDLAAALVNYVIGTIALETFWVATAHGCHTTYVMGGIFDHIVPREAFQEWFQGKALVVGKMQAKCRVVKLSSFVGVLGALADEQTN